MLVLVLIVAGVSTGFVCGMYVGTHIPQLKAALSSIVGQEKAKVEADVSQAVTKAESTVKADVAATLTPKSS